MKRLLLSVNSMKTVWVEALYARPLYAITLGLAGALLLSACSEESPATAQGVSPARESLVLYSSLPHARTLALAEAYREDSGVTVNFLIESAAGLVDTLAEKRDRPAADVLLVEGTGTLARAIDRDVLRPVPLELPESLDPLAPMDPDGYWYGLGYVADAILVSGRSGLDGGLSYKDLGGPAFEGRLCMRRGHSDRGRALVASMLAVSGVRDTELMVRGWRNNSATMPVDGPESLVQALREGRCEVAVLGTDRTLAHGLLVPGSPIEAYLPDASDDGTVVHPIAAGVSRHSENPELSVAFLRWLLEPSGQRVLHRDGTAFPASGAVSLPEALLPLSKELSENASVSSAAFHYEEALSLIDRAGYRRTAD
jgi:iron(III) transport system substrate-binding protein